MSPLPSLSNVLLRTQADERLARLVGNGDQSAFAMLVQRHRGSLLRIATSVVGSQRSEDVVQQALLRAWVSLAAGTQVRNVQAWLYRIVRNAAYAEYSRGRHGTDPVPEELAGVDPTEAVEQRLAVRELVQRIAALPEHQRTALVETELKGRSREQIATDMGLSEGAVRQLVHRARTALRIAMTAVTPYPLLVWISRHTLASRLDAGLSSIGEDAARRSAPLAEPAASGAAAGGALAIKGGAALLAAGAIGGLSWHSLTNRPVHHHHGNVLAASLRAERNGEAPRTAVSRAVPANGIGSIAAASVRPLTIPLAIASQRAVRAAPATGAVARAGTLGSQAGHQQPRPANEGSNSDSSAMRSEPSAGTSGSDGGRSTGDGASRASSGSPGQGSEDDSSPSALGTARATSPTDGPSDRSSGGDSTARLPGGDH